MFYVRRISCPTYQEIDIILNSRALCSHIVPPKVYIVINILEGDVSTIKQGIYAYLFVYYDGPQMALHQWHKVSLCDGKCGLLETFNEIFPILRKEILMAKTSILQNCQMWPANLQLRCDFNTDDGVTGKLSFWMGIWKLMGWVCLILRVRFGNRPNWK